MLRTAPRMIITITTALLLAPSPVTAHDECSENYEACTQQAYDDWESCLRVAGDALDDCLDHAVEHHPNDPQYVSMCHQQHSWRTDTCNWENLNEVRECYMEHCD